MSTNWYIKPCAHYKKAKVTLDDGKKYDYLCDTGSAVGDVMFVSVGKTRGHLGKISEVATDNKRPKKLNRLNLQFAKDPTKADINNVAKNLVDLSDLETFYKTFEIKDYGYSVEVNKHELPIFMEYSRRIICALTVIAFSNLAKPADVEKAKAYLNNKFYIPACLFKRDVASALVERDMQIDPYLVVDDWDKFIDDLPMWKEKKYQEYYEDNLIYIDSGIMKAFKDNETLPDEFDKLVRRSTYNILKKSKLDNLVEVAEEYGFGE